MMIFILGLIVLGAIAIAFVAMPLWRDGRRAQAVLGSVFVAGSAIGLYLLIGRPDLALQPPTPASAQMQPQDIEQMVGQLAERLEQNADDPEGWTMLGRSYVMLGRYEEAANAFSQAQEHTADENPDLLASFAEARVLADPEGLASEIGTLFERVLQLDPGNPRGLWYGGLAAQARGDAQVALERWQMLLQQDLPAEFQDVVEARIAALDPAAAGVLLDAEIDIAPEMADRIPASGVLYLFVRAVGDGNGQPIAARRSDNVDPPLKLSLMRGDLLRGDELPETALEVVVRISADADPAPAPGDLEGSVNWDPSETETVRITVDSVRGE